MRSVLPWRTRPALWLLGPFLFLAFLFTTQSNSLSITPDYWDSSLSEAAIFLLFSCGLASVSAAIELGRVRSARLANHIPARNLSTVLFNRLWPSYAAAILVQTAATLFVLSSAPTLVGTVPLILVPTYLVIILFHLIVGAALGRLLPAVVATPAALLFSYVWLGFLWSLSYFPARYLSGLAISNCCAVSYKLDPRGPAAAITFSAVASVALLPLLVSWSRRRLIRAVGPVVVVLATALASGLWIARDLGYGPYVQRPLADAACSGSSPSVCLFPQQRVPRDPSPVVRKALANLHQVGIRTPDRVETYDRASSPSVLQMVVNPGMSDAELVHSLSAAFLTPQLSVNCPGRNYASDLRTASAVNYWYIAYASRGIANKATVGAVVPGGEAEARAALKLPLPLQLKWIAQNQRALRSCAARTVAPGALS